MPVIIGGIEPFTTVDFPERLAAVLFCSGCPLRCPYCHNPELQNFKSEPFITWERFVEFLIDRKKLLDGVVFSGGEPLAQPDLYESMKFVKDLGYEIGLHTSGVNVSRLEQVLPLVSWVGFDVKTVFDAYETRIPHSRRETVESCLDALVKSGVDFECRTTLDPRVISKSELRSLARDLANRGVKTYALQQYRPHPSEKEPPESSDIVAFFTDRELLDDLRGLFKNFIIRRG